MTVDVGAGRGSAPPAEDPADWHFPGVSPVAAAPSGQDSGHRDALRRPAVTVSLLVGLVGASFALRAGGLASWLWMDEGISVGIASHRLSEIPGLLRQDGSPPLYYLLLHGWIGLFGASEAATHSLSLALSLATIPVALWAGWSLFGRRVGWTFAALVAVSPFLAYFATETRMYALATLLSLVAIAAFLHCFAFGRRRYLWVFATALSLVLYTHNWGLWLGAGLAVALVPCAVAATDRRRFWIDAAVSFGAVGVAYLPWLPTLASQRAHTGAPWSSRPLPREAVSVVAAVLGDTHERVLVALLLVGGPALWTLLRGRGALQSPLLAIALIASVPVGIGWLAAQASPSWASRYLAVCVPAILLLAAIALSQAGRRGFVALALILLFWVQPLGRITGLRPAARLDDKADVKPLASAVAPGLHPGDLVLVMQMEEVPVLAYYLPSGLRFATAVGRRPTADVGIADWRNALARMEATTVATGLQPELDATAMGSKVLLLCQQPVDHGRTVLPWFSQMELRCQQWRAALQSDPRFSPAVALADQPTSSLAKEESKALAARQVLAFIKTAE